MDIKKAQGGSLEKPPPSYRIKNYSPDADRPQPCVSIPIHWGAVCFGLRQGTVGHKILGTVGYYWGL